MDNTKINTLGDIKKLVKENYVFFVVLAIIVVALYGNIANGEFLNLDDNTGIIYNLELKDFNATLKTFSLGKIYTATIIKIFGLNSSAFHVGSIILHFVNCLMVFIFTSILFGKKISIISTLFFASHPVNSETVGWISSRGYLLNTIFILSTLIFFFLFRNSSNRNYLYTSVGIYLFNIVFMRDPWSMITPFLIVIIDQIIINKNINYKKIASYIPYILISLIFMFIVVMGQLTSRVTTLETKHYLKIEGSTPLLNRIPYTIYMAAKLLLAPIELAIYHEGKIITSIHYTTMFVVSGLIAFLTFNLLKKHRIMAGLIVAIYFSILPSFSPILIAWSIAERYLYISSIFFAVLLTMLIFNINKKIKIKDFTIIAVSIIFVLYSVRTILRTEDLKSSENLWLATMKVAPYSYRVYNNLGDVYANRGDYEIAIENFKRSVALKPDYADAIHNIGFSYMQLGEMDKAKSYLVKSYEMNPFLYQAAYKIGVIELDQKNLNQAKKYFEDCLNIEPKNADCYNALVTVEKIISSQSIANP